MRTINKTTIRIPIIHPSHIIECGERPPYTTGLQFQRPVSDKAGDPDETMLMEAMKGLVK